MKDEKRKEESEQKAKVCHPDVMCPICNIKLIPEHAHAKCPKCHYRDSCCF
jgi:hypothetical protein